MKPEKIKTTGYLVSSVSVALLGGAAWPGAEERGLVPVLVLGMAASIGGMDMRWWSYEVERRSRRQSRMEEARASSPAYSLSNLER